MPAILSFSMISSAPIAPEKQPLTPASFLPARVRRLFQNLDFRIAFFLTIICAVTRWIALPASLWEWDDILFARALHRYDIPAHSPHPPGFPIFVLLTRGANYVLHNDHLALAIISLLFASTLGAGFYYFYLAVFQDRVIAMSGALLGMFAPNIWVHSGAGRSDEAGLALGLIGSAMILRGLRSSRLFVGGCLLLGLGLGVRVTLLPVMGLLVITVSLIRLYHKQWKPVILGALVSFLGVISWYIPVLVHTTLPMYRKISAGHTEFWLANDTMFSPTLNSDLTYRLTRFGIDVWGELGIAITVYALALVGLLALLLRRQWAALGWMAVSFLPFITFTFVLNTPLSAPFYAMPYVPFFMGLAACGLVLFFRFFFPEERWPLLSQVGLLLAVGLAAGGINWSYPLIKVLRKEPSPPIQAVAYLKKTLDKEKDKLYFDGLYTPYAYYYFPTYPIEELLPNESIALNLINPANSNYERYYLLSSDPGIQSQHFQWTHGRGTRRLRTLSLGRYFDSYVTDLSPVRNLIYSSGWYQAESSSAQSWRWMGKKGTVALFNAAEEMTLYLQGQGIERANLSDKATIIVRLDGQEIARFAERDIALNRTIRTASAKLWSTLTIETDATFIPKQRGQGTDERELGFQCFVVRWEPTVNSVRRRFTDDQFIGAGWDVLWQAKPRSWRWAEKDASLQLPAVEGAARQNSIGD
jgi:hypothetical protein